MSTVLIVEDEQVLGKSIAEALGDDGFKAHWISNAEDAVEWLDKRSVDLAFMDIRLPGMSGLELLDIMAERHPETVCIMMTAKTDVETAVDAMKAGAADFLIKPLDLDAVSEIAKRQSKQRRIAQNWKYVQKNHAMRFGLHQFLGDCAEIERAKALVRRLGAVTPAEGTAPPSILISGPTGSGKDLLARAIHYEGQRREGQFVQINCAAIPATLLESELFGHVKGAFTSAQTSKRGLFEVADGGTLFLDELGSLELPLQAKILVAIESSRIRPVGSTVEVPVDVQLVAAMNQDPEQWLAEGKLREDLYHRLRVIHIELPPLASRGDDVLLLAEHLIGSHCSKFGLGRKHLTAKAKSRLRRYHWPGNVRELSHRLESAVLLSKGDKIDEDLLPESAGRPLTKPGDGDTGLNVDFSKGPISLEAVETSLIRRALESSSFNVTRAAELLGLSRDTLRYRVEKHGLMDQRNGKSI